MHCSELDFPVGCFVNWNNNFFKVVVNKNDITGEALNSHGHIQYFIFNCGGVKSERITCPVRIAELNEQFSTFSQW